MFAFGPKDNVVLWATIAGETNIKLVVLEGEAGISGTDEFEDFVGDFE